MLKEFRFIPTTADSKPFIPATYKCDFAGCGYVEDEYFQYGTANVYTENELHEVSPIYEGAPYCTRVVIRRPVDKTKFSGNVVVEILNSSANIDIDRMWVNSWQFFTRNGDIYVGISSKGHVVDALKAFDPVRYADICWDNPLPDRPIPESAKANTMIKFLSQYESGLYWDIQLDTMKLLKSDSDENPLKDYGKCWFYLTGWSQSTGYVNRTLKSFAYRPENCENGPLFDGYLNGGGGVNLAPINAYEPQPRAAVAFPSGGVNGAREPFIAVNTETENRSSYWYGDFDEPDYKFRTWQIAGSSHDSKYNLLTYYGEEDLAMLDNIGIHNGFYGVDGDPLDTPHEAVFSAAFYALFRWVRDGVPAPHAPKIETYISKTPIQAIGKSFVGNLTDGFGNCRGGIRIPAVAYPLGKYTPTATKADGSISGAFGKFNAFSAEFLNELYGSLDNYAALLNAEYDRLVAKGFLLEGDRDYCIGYSLERAKGLGLK